MCTIQRGDKIYSWYHGPVWGGGGDINLGSKVSIHSLQSENLVLAYEMERISLV